MKIILKTTLHCSKVYAFATILIVIRCGKTLINRLAPTPIWWGGYNYFTYQTGLIFNSTWIPFFFVEKAHHVYYVLVQYRGKYYNMFVSKVIHSYKKRPKSNAPQKSCINEEFMSSKNWFYSKYDIASFLELFSLSLIPIIRASGEQLQSMKWVILNYVYWKLNIGMEALSCISLVQFCSKSKWRLW